MNLNHYQTLNFKQEPVSVYRRRRQAFAIANRFNKPSHYVYIADQIVDLDLVAEFIRFAPSG